VIRVLAKVLFRVAQDTPPGVVEEDLE